jgi:hypothetical protein
MKLHNAFLGSLLLIGSTAIAAAEQSRSFYDQRGSFAGSSVERGNSTRFTDRNGRFNGTPIRNSDRTTSFYDKNGHFTGSSVNTSQVRINIAASPKCGLLNQSHTRTISC